MLSGDWSAHRSLNQPANFKKIANRLHPTLKRIVSPATLFAWKSLFESIHCLRVRFSISASLLTPNHKTSCVTQLHAALAAVAASRDDVITFRDDRSDSKQRMRRRFRAATISNVQISERRGAQTVMLTRQAVVSKLFLIVYRLWVRYCHHVPSCSGKTQSTKYYSIKGLENWN